MSAADLYARGDLKGAAEREAAAAERDGYPVTAGIIRDLAAENERLREELRLRENSQIPVIPEGASRKLAKLEAEIERLREALEAAAVPLSLLGKGSLDDRMNDALEIIRAALAAVPEERG